ncbi:MAG TPA: ABC transporter permease, partial [Longimicrobiaceae bacterium]|nr:ABC transporter permease [Longimicrobiaceae bacterium]
MNTLLQDLRYAVRQLFRSPGFTLVAVLTLALGIGANTAIFSAVSRVVLNPFPFQGADRMVYAMQAHPKADMMTSPSADVAEAWMRNAHSFDGLEPLTYARFFLGGRSEPVILSGTRVSPTFLSFLGLTPALGRMFTPEEAKPGGPHVVLLSYESWRRDFGGSRDVLGKSIRLNDALYTVIGVMPQRLAVFVNSDVWVPFRLRAQLDSLPQWFSLLGRIKPGVTREQATRELTAIADRVPQKYSAGWPARLVSLRDGQNGDLRQMLLVLFGAVGLVLLIACANVAQLLLARGAARERELAVRLSLGAGRGRLIRQLLVESVILSLCGGALGLLLAWWGVDALSALRPESLSDLAHVEMDGRVVLFGVGLSLATGILFGIFPALRATDLRLTGALKSGTAGSGSAVGTRRFRSGLVAVETALSVVLLVGAGLLVRSLFQMQRAEIGFRPEGLLTVDVSLPSAHYSNRSAQIAFSRELVARARALPGVAAATRATSVPPAGGYTPFADVEVDGAPPVDAPPSGVGYNSVQPDYFRILGIRILEGRSFTEQEDRTDANVVVLSEGLAQRIAPGGSAVGLRLRTNPTAEWQTVVGVVDDVYAMARSGEMRHLQYYTPYGDGPEIPGIADPGRLIVQARGDDAAALAPMLRQMVHSMDPDVVVREVATVESLLGKTLAAPRFDALLLTLFAGLALLLAAVGLFGVLSY